MKNLLLVKLLWNTAAIASTSAGYSKEDKRSALKRKNYAELSIEERQRTITNISESRSRRKRRRQTTHTPVSKMSMRDCEGTELYQLPSMVTCQHCSAMKFKSEPPTFCCEHGMVQLASEEIPEQLRYLFTATDDNCIEFRRNVRRYNSIFSFTSFGVKLDKALATSTRGIYTFRAQGQVYHNLPGLIPNAGKPSYFQLYFYDCDHEVHNRMNIFADVNLTENTVKLLMCILERNPYARFFRSLKDQPSFQSLEIHIVKNVQLDQRVYNSPISDEIGAIWIEGNHSNISSERDIIVSSHSGKRHRVQHYYGCYDPLQYPILFPSGEIGWHSSLEKKINRDEFADGSSSRTTNKNYASVEDIFNKENEGDRASRNHISCRAYYCYKLQIRKPLQSVLLLAGRLLQQYVVDMYIKLETCRLDYFRRHQDKLRTELYQGIVDSIKSGETRASQIGKRIVLPSSFIGGPRDMRRRYLDAMALVQKYGKPDVFITMTCNPEWIEIRQELYEGQTVQDRPDLTARVFHAKLEDLKDQLFKKMIFGEVAAHVGVIEFQKRGLPHAHILIIMKSGFKIKTADQVDTFVSAEIPDGNIFPRLHGLVIKHMMHGPCGKLNMHNSCMVDGQCKSHYPRSYCSETVQGEDGYPIYRRRQDITVQVRKATLDNRWVVPYNPYLLARYNCHINMEICSGIQAVKYLYKYIYKGHDRVAIYIADNEEDNVIDEINQFQDARWVSAQEAIWRIYRFPLNDIYPAVVNLQLHLPRNHSVSFQASTNFTDIIDNVYFEKTMLTEFFKLCQRNEQARHYLYRDIPQMFVWKKTQKSWTERKRRDVIGRVNVANPAEGERYYLRLLLNHIKGPTSFEHLRTVNNVELRTFKEAAEKLGFLEKDASICECLDEAAAFQMPHALRKLFATLLVFCEPNNEAFLWKKYEKALSEDYRREERNNEALVLKKTLTTLDNLLESMGKAISMFDIPGLSQYLSIDISSTTDETHKEIIDELSVEIPERDLDIEFKLNPEQQIVFSSILRKVHESEGGVFFIDGPGGTGKTYLYRALLSHFRKKKQIALATATSGIAASIMPGGRTAHSRFKIPILTNDTTTCNISVQSGLAELIRQAKLIIWDEASMARRSAVETLDRSLRDIMKSNAPFGGKVLIFGGDFRQVLPVIQRGTVQQIIDASLVKSYLWPYMQRFTLTRNMRARDDVEFCNFLLRVGNDEEPTDAEGNIELPDDIVIEYSADDDNISVLEDKLLERVYPSLAANATAVEYIMKRAILTTTNEFVDRLNEKLISKFPGEEKVYTSFDTAIDDAHHSYPEEFLNSLSPTGLPPHKLVLKQNSPIMLLRNLNPMEGLSNGTKMICKACRDNVIQAEIYDGQHRGKEYFLPRIPLQTSQDESYPFHFTRKQFPVRLCFAMTINKAQGQTIPFVGIYLPQPVFSHGQLYVALSRGTTLRTTSILTSSKRVVTNAYKRTKNIVYKQVLELVGNKNPDNSNHEEYTPGEEDEHI